jgi:hypothetical protein
MFCPGSEFFLSWIPDPHKKFIYNPKNCFYALGSMIRDYHTGSDPDLIFYPSRIPDPGVKKAPNPGSATL